MGLDQYLTRKVYLGLNYEHNRENLKETSIKIDGKKYDYKKLKELSFEAAYWRKCNSIHKFFVDEVQKGEDDCREYYVSKEILEKLIDYCKKDIKYFNTLKYEDSQEKEDFFTKKKFKYKIYKNINEDKLNLKTQSGFFFGSTEYDEYYVNDLKDTVKQLEECLKEEGEGDFYYRSSW